VSASPGRSIRDSMGMPDMGRADMSIDVHSGEGWSNAGAWAALAVKHAWCLPECWGLRRMGSVQGLL
jgi:hypothetical protein